MRKDRIELYIDTEDDSKGNFILGVIFDASKGLYNTFKDRDSMRKYILSYNFADVFAHNCAYDIGNLFTLDQLSFKYCKSKFISATYENNGHYIRFFDSMNLLPVSLRSIGRTLGMDKLDMKKDDLEIYCTRDVEILVKFVKNIRDFCADLDVNFSRTLSSIAWNYFKRLSGQNSIQLPDGLDEKIRPSYFGGRVEIFRIGKYEREFFENDVNSMYPYSMMINFPNWRTLKETKYLDMTADGIADVTVIQDNAVPVLPVRIRTGSISRRGKSGENGR